MKLFKPNARPTLRSVIGRGHLIVALLAISMASLSLTFLGVLALRVYADHNLHLIARSISSVSYTHLTLPTIYSV